MKRTAALWMAAGVALFASTFAAACKREPDRFAKTDEAAAPILGDRNHGLALLSKHECARCHTGLPTQEQVAPEKACVGCHERIMSGAFTASKEAIDKWQPLVKDLRYAPSLDHTERLRQSWMEGFLKKPHDLRPGLRMNMPRLGLDANDARDLAAFLKSREPTAALASVVKGPGLAKGNAERGKTLLGQKSCTFCHRIAGAPDIAITPFTALAGEKLERAMALAPDLRHARDRMDPAVLAAWIQKPSALKPNSDMPDLAVTEEEARDMTTYLVTATLASPATPPLQRLPVLAREVRFDEVNTKVFHRTCWHCHSEPDFAIGDGGPGNSGGFGFLPRGVDLSSYQGILGGFFAKAAPAKGETAPRKSLFAPTADGTPHLVAALLARHAEEAGADTGAIRGMPLGMPPLPAEDIQLVESWVAQGRKR